MIDISSTMLELSNDRATQEEAQDVARCLRTLYCTPVGSLEGDRLLGIIQACSWTSRLRWQRVFMWQRSRKRPQPLSRGHGWCVWTGWRMMRCTEQ